MHRIISTLAVLTLFLSSLPKLYAQQIWQIRDYSSERISSYDISGANDDGNWKNKIKPGDTRTIGEVAGPGIIKHIWITIASNEPQHLKK
ncbi:hypothetical protein LWM68_46680 [Niabella sp. W65]|nr:hypothetical protein [Niabella sp. W65]MCH7369558.1 hypothetical protein [Niabella sp. W65]ULT45099.1 hypothetical protein KRR40_18450 [Niabella sp. I65]